MSAAYQELVLLQRSQRQPAAAARRGVEATRASHVQAPLVLQLQQPLLLLRDPLLQGLPSPLLLELLLQALQLLLVYREVVIGRALCGRAVGLRQLKLLLLL